MNEKEKLEKYATGYLKPDLGRQVDNKILRLMVEEILPWVRGPEILEMGFGDDAWTGKVVEKFGHSSIVDASEKVLTKAHKKYGHKVETFTALFEEFESATKYNTVLASFVLEHVEDPVQVLRQASGWIKVNGKIIILVPHAGSFHRRLGLAMGVQKKLTDLSPADQKIGHRRVYTLEGLEKDIIRAGLKIRRKKGLFVKFLPQGMMTHFSPQLLAGLAKMGQDIPIEYSASVAYECSLGKK